MFPFSVLAVVKIDGHTAVLKNIWLLHEIIKQNTLCKFVLLWNDLSL